MPPAFPQEIFLHLICHGDADGAQLTPYGEQQAASLGTYLRSNPLYDDAVWCSSAGPAIETLATIRTSLKTRLENACIDERLAREQGRAASVPQTGIQAQPLESWLDTAINGNAFRVPGATRTIAAVTDAETIKELLRLLVGIPRASLDEGCTDPTSVTSLHQRRHRACWGIRRINANPHLASTSW